MDPTGIMLFFTFLGVIGVVGLVLAGVGVTRFVRERSSGEDVPTRTRIRCCGVDLSIALLGAGIVFLGIFSFVRVIT